MSSCVTYQWNLLKNKKLFLLAANLGGVYSLFVGMSVLSFIEIFYFFSVRLYKNYKQVKENENRIFQVKPIKFVDKLKSSELIFNLPATIEDPPTSGDSKKTIVVTGFIN